METWSSEIIKTIDSKLEGTREKEIRFYRIEEFKRNIQRVDEFSASCPYCAKEKINISDVTQKIDEAIKVPGKSRREYDRLISRLSSHMHKQHGFITPYYYTYLFSFFGMVAGLLIGYFLQKLLPMQNWEMLMLGFIAGLLPGYFT
ncbi:MAG: AtpZ/AtpI family protein, partial [Prolixibacteraceae bacterium]|nr:AtpZ/AtpI family protein [Prolixibacteraceae bacterium]